ncbi:hypothetical protein IWQ62_004268 [Dispira parvispora]|uniref:Uncharacterized protein n=1 Tax=Dispira parvispora TaxID=1520584 RepID=A0A9W8AM92_9FUNG|nr:hypothetical protein IWQ62_004268 [Dispira parvispora]
MASLPALCFTPKVSGGPTHQMPDIRQRHSFDSGLSTTETLVDLSVDNTNPLKKATLPAQSLPSATSTQLLMHFYQQLPERHNNAPFRVDTVTKILVLYYNFHERLYQAVKVTKHTVGIFEKALLVMSTADYNLLHDESLKTVVSDLKEFSQILEGNGYSTKTVEFIFQEALATIQKDLHNSNDAPLYESYDQNIASMSIDDIREYLKVRNQDTVMLQSCEVGDDVRYQLMSHYSHDPQDIAIRAESIANESHTCRYRIYPADDNVQRMVVYAILLMGEL